MVKEYEMERSSGKIASDDIHIFLSYRAPQSTSKLIEWLKGIGLWTVLRGFQPLKKQFWDRGYLAVSPGTITDEMIQ